MCISNHNVGVAGPRTAVDSKGRAKRAMLLIEAITFFFQFLLFFFSQFKPREDEQLAAGTGRDYYLMISSLLVNYKNEEGEV